MTGLPRAVVVVAFHRPDHRLARRLIGSLLSQSGVEVGVVAVLDGEATRGDRALAALLDDRRIVVVGSEAALGVRGAFAHGLQRALALNLDERTCFAYADQDDDWHPDKLARCLARLRDTSARLVHCDARVTDEAGQEIAPRLHAFEERQNADTLLEALLLNAVSGMTALFDQATARLTCRLMDGLDSELLHDHVTAVAAASLGPVVFLPEVLVDYVQHGGNTLGAKALLHRPWYRRAMTARDLVTYRRTSRGIFEERRPLARALRKEGLLPRDLAHMFLVGEPPPSLPHLVLRYWMAMLRLFLHGQSRRGFLCFRAMDGAWQRRRGIGLS